MEAKPPVVGLDAKAAAGGEARIDAAPLGSIRGGVDKIDLLMNMVGELVITQSMLGVIDHDTELDARRIEQLREGLSLLARNTRSPQESVMRLRSVPISVVFSRFPRLVHDLSQQLGKEVELKVNGQGTEIDEDCVDAVMEIGNMVAGGIKTALSETRYAMSSISLPSLVLGDSTTWPTREASASCRWSSRSWACRSGA